MAGVARTVLLGSCAKSQKVKFCLQAFELQ